jgi:hypothetical protein
MSSSNVSSSTTPILGRGARRSLTKTHSRLVAEPDSDDSIVESDGSGDSEWQEPNHGKGKQVDRSKRQISSDSELFDGEETSEGEDKDESMGVRIIISFTSVF